MSGMQMHHALVQNRRVTQWLRAVLIVLAILYLIQVASPLRLNTDAVVLLSMAESAVEGNGFLYRGQPTYFPPGYPMIVATLEYLNLANSSMLIATNCAFLGFGLFAVFYILRRAYDLDQSTALLACCLALLSFVMVKHATIPLTDVPFFGVCMLALMIIVAAEQRPYPERLRWLAFAWIVTLCAVSVRRVGVVLAVPICWAALPPRSEWTMRLQQCKDQPLRALRVIVLATGALIVTAMLVTTTSTAEDATTIYATSTVRDLIAMLVQFRTAEWGELALNIPRSKLPAATVPFVLGIGVITLGSIVCALVSRLPRFSAADVFLSAYMGVILVWPFEDARFWIPALPLIVGLLISASARVPSSGQKLLTAYACSFCVTGLLALGWSTRLSLAGDRFPLLYGDGTYQPAYIAAFQGTNRDTTAAVNAELLHLLQRHELRSKPSEHDHFDGTGFRSRSR